MVLVKAMPHRSSNYFETVCCAGIGHDRKWRRLYPVPFRILEDDQKFRRWNWVKYRFTRPSDDDRAESQKVVPESIDVLAEMNKAERSKLACYLTRDSLKHADSLKETLTLIEPTALTLSWKQKSERTLADETAKHAALASQLSMFDKPTKPLEPCPFSFHVKWKSMAGDEHTHACDDWETSTAFFRRRLIHGEQGGLISLKQTYEEQYLKKGMRFALGTHSRRDWQWLLVGILRVDGRAQPELGL